MNSNYAWGYLIAVLHRYSGSNTIDETQAAANAAGTGLFLAQQGGRVSNKPIIHTSRG